MRVAVVIMEKKTLNSLKEKLGSASFLSLSCHPSTFFGAATTCLCALLAVVDIVVFTFTSASITYVGTQITELLCKLAIH
jgi:hypothetical protein